MLTWQLSVICFNYFLGGSTAELKETSIAPYSCMLAMFSNGVDAFIMQYD